MKKQINFSAINLGCSKNLVDTEFVIGELLGSSNDFNFFPDFEDKEVEFVILNTCGFLSSARAEAEDMVEYLDTLGKKIILIGCYTKVKDDEFLKTIKNLVAIVGYEELKNLKDKILELKS